MSIKPRALGGSSGSVRCTCAHGEASNVQASDTFRGHVRFCGTAWCALEVKALASTCWMQCQHGRPCTVPPSAEYQPASYSSPLTLRFSGNFSASGRWLAAARCAAAAAASAAAAALAAFCSSVSSFSSSLAELSSCKNSSTRQRRSKHTQRGKLRDTLLNRLCIQ